MRNHNTYQDLNHTNKDSSQCGNYLHPRRGFRWHVYIPTLFKLFPSLSLHSRLGETDCSSVLIVWLVINDVRAER